MNDAMDYGTLAHIMEEAAGYYEWKKGRQRLLRVILNFSYRLELPEAAFSSHEVLMKHTRLNQKRLSEAIADLVRCRVIHRRGEGKGGVVLTPLPDWMDWGLSPVDEECSEREFVASLVRHTVKQTPAGYVAIPYPAEAVDPATQYAIAYARGAFNHTTLIPDDQVLNEPIAEIAKQIAASNTALPSVPKRKPGRPETKRERTPSQKESETPINADFESVDAYAAQLFPPSKWEPVRRQGWLCKVGKDRGYRSLSLALRLAKDFGPERIFAPCNWLKRVLKDLSPPKLL